MLWRCVLMMQATLLWALLVIVLTTPAVFAQEGSTSHPRPAPQISGTLLHTDGVRLSLGYRDNSKPEIFNGTIQSTCMLPAEAKSRESKPLELSAVPTGTRMTVFYVSDAKAGQAAKPSGNVILALRFDRVPRESDLPLGVPIPCFKAAEKVRR